MRLFVLVFALLCASTAFAQSDRAEEAKQRYKAGKALYDTGDYPGAIEQYKKSYQLSKLPLLLFNIAQAYRLHGDAEEALASYERFVDAAPTSPYVKEANQWIRSLSAQVKREREARQREAEAKKREEEAARREAEANQRAAAAEKNSADAQRQAEEARRREAEAKKREEEAVRREQQASKKGESDDKAIAQPPKDPSPPAATNEERGGGLSALGYGGIAAAGVGLGLVGVGGYFGLKAKAAESDINGEDSAWTDSLLDEFDDGEAHEKKMWIFAGAGAGLVVVGTALLVYDLVGGDSGSERTVSFAPQLDGETTGFAVVGSF